MTYYYSCKYIVKLGRFVKYKNIKSERLLKLSGRALGVLSYLPDVVFIFIFNYISSVFHESP